LRIFYIIWIMESLWRQGAEVQSNNAKTLVNEELNHTQTCYDCMKRHVYFELCPHTLSCVSSTHVHDHFFLFDALVDEKLLRVYCHYSLFRGRKQASVLLKPAAMPHLVLLRSIFVESHFLQPLVKNTSLIFKCGIMGYDSNFNFISKMFEFSHCHRKT
jgi:hypothetical protein